MSQLQVPTPEIFRAATEAKTVIITGAAQGIGYAIAEAFATAGANVVLADMDETSEQPLKARSDMALSSLNAT
jgi:NAD(P)-dependent dehydrogenase (short-subunit alcohol dehydrogenase family)